MMGTIKQSAGEASSAMPLCPGKRKMYEKQKMVSVYGDL